MVLHRLYVRLVWLSLTIASAVLSLSAQPPNFQPQLVAFSVPANSTTTQSRSITISGIPGQSWRIRSLAPWLKFIAPPICIAPGADCTLTSMSAPSTFLLLVNPSGLEPTTYSTLVSVSYPGGANTMQVTLNVGSGANVLTANPTSLSFSAIPQGNSQSQTLQISSNTPNVFFNASSNATWLTTSVGMGTAPEGSGVTVTANPGGLGTGTYTGTLTFVPNLPTGGVGAPLAVPVTLVVSTSARFTASPTSLGYYQIAVANSSPGSTPLTIGVTTGPPIPYTATISYSGTAANWLSPNPATGQTGTPLIFTPTGWPTLPLGTYSATVTISAPGVPSLTVPANLTIVAPPSLVASPTALSLSVQPNTTGTQNLLIDSSGGGGVTIAVQYASPQTPAVNWLSLSYSGTVTPAGVAVTASPASLPPGTYTANLMVTSTNLGVGPVTVPVTMIVTNSQVATYSPSFLRFSFVGGGPAPFDQVIQLGLTPAIPSQPATVSAIHNVPGQSWMIAVLMSPSFGSIVDGVDRAGSHARIVISPTGLPNGTYTGKVRIQAPGVSNSVIDVPVTLTVAGVTGGGGSSGSVNPSIAFSPSQLSFTAPVNGTAPDQNLIFTSTGASLTYSLSANAGWITVLNGTAAAPATSTVRVNANGLLPGNYNGQIAVSSAGASNNGATIPVTLTVTAATPGAPAQFSLSPASLSFTAQANGFPPTPKLVSVLGQGTVPYLSLTTNQSWLSPQISSDGSPTFRVAINPQNLTAGTYTGIVTVTFGSSSLNLPVSLEVTNSGTVLKLSQQDVTFNYQLGQAAPAPVPIRLNTTGELATPLSANPTTTNGGNWLSVSSQLPFAPGVTFVTLARNVIAALPPGTYSGTVAVFAIFGANSRAQVNVTLNVSANPVLTAASTAIAFNAQVNGGAPPVQTRSLTASSGSLPLAVSVSPSFGAGWLSASINSASTPATLTIGAAPSGWGTGTYTATVTVTAGNSATALSIPVTLTVSPLPSIVSDKAELSFMVNGPSPVPAQNLTIGSSGTNFTFVAYPNVSTGPPIWLASNFTTGVTPSTISLTANPAQLTDGSYFGTVSISAQGVSNSPLIVPVTFTVGTPVSLQVAPTVINFVQVQGAAPPAAQAVQVSSPAAATFGYTLPPPAGGNWLTVTQSSQQTNGTLVIRLNDAASTLPAGDYLALITVITSNSPNSVAVTVRLTVTAPNRLLIDPTTLNFAGRAGPGSPLLQTVQVRSSRPDLPISFSVSSDASWLTASASSDSTPASLTVAVNPAALPTDTPNATGRLTVVTAGGAGRTTITVFFAFDRTASPVIAALVNSATFQAGSLSPGMLFTIVGTDLGPAPGVAGQVVAGHFTTTLGGVRVLLDGIPAPILYASKTQINAVVPYALTGRASARLTVESNQFVSPPISPRLTDAAPGIFTVDGHQAAALNENGTPNNALNPAPAGTVVVLYLTGEGQTTPVGVDGEIVAANNLKRPLGAVRVRVNGRDVPDANILYAGSAPSLVSGLMQINFRLPSDEPANAAAAVEVYVGSGQSALGTTIAVRR